MKNILIINDGDLYGYIFSLFILRRIENINLKFIKLNENVLIKKSNVLSSTSCINFMNNNVNIFGDEITKFRGSFSLCLKLNNFFDKDDISYITNEKETFDNVDGLKNQLKFNKKIKNDIYSLLYESVLLSEKDIFFKLDDAYNLHFENEIFKKYILKKCNEFKNFDYVQTNDIEKHFDKYDIVVDNTLNNICSYEKNKKINNCQVFDIQQDTIDYDNCELEMKNYIQYQALEDGIEEKIFLYDKIILNNYKFKQNFQYVHDYFYNNRIINIGVSFFNNNLTFLYDQILHFYLIEKAINLIETFDFRESKIYKINDECNYILKNINHLINKLFYYSCREDGFWQKFNTVEYYDIIKSFNLNYEILNISNINYEIFENLYFDSNINYAVFEPSMIFNLYDLKRKQENILVRFFTNQYQYLKQNIYKEKERLTILR